ncbi:uncharacterized protein BJX67DRAFT_35914 [Aspergillus lucknowensis]|uniref:Uncharacterized protein n=1 Tax=Aspergillus lucknowensis TaxID=176173 RepID=A0ABR4LW22_9EURO
MTKIKPLDSGELGRDENLNLSVWLRRTGLTHIFRQWREFDAPAQKQVEILPSSARQGEEQIEGEAVEGGEKEKAKNPSTPREATKKETKVGEDFRSHPRQIELSHAHHPLHSMNNHCSVLFKMLRGCPGSRSRVRRSMHSSCRATASPCQPSSPLRQETLSDADLLIAALCTAHASSPRESRR